MKSERKAIIISVILLSITSVITSLTILFQQRKKNKYAELPMETYYRRR